MTDQAISPLRRRMIEDMTIRRFAPKTQSSYIRAVRNFTVFLGRSPDQASAEDLRRYQLHLASSGVATPSLNATVTALRFFFGVTLGRSEITERMPFVREPRKLPVVLSPEEVTRFLEAAPGLKVSGSAERGLWRGPARQRGGLAQDLGYRQQPDGHPGRTGQAAVQAAAEIGKSRVSGPSWCWGRRLLPPRQGAILNPRFQKPRTGDGVRLRRQDERTSTMRRPRDHWRIHQFPIDLSGCTK
jgi:hypothetical protein